MSESEPDNCIQPADPDPAQILETEDKADVETEQLTPTEDGAESGVATDDNNMASNLHTVEARTTSSTSPNDVACRSPTPVEADKEVMQEEKVPSSQTETVTDVSEALDVATDKNRDSPMDETESTTVSAIPHNTESPVTENAVPQGCAVLPTEGDVHSVATSVALAAVDEDSCQSVTLSEPTTSPQKKTRVTNSKLMLTSLPQGVGADALFEYKWPPTDNHSDYWMLQEQVSTFLDVKSFRRKYPDLERRQIEMEERNYLLSVGAVTEMQCDLGLTALRSDDISDLMMQDYSDKYEEYAKVLRKREEERIAKRHQHLQDLQTSTPAQPAVSKMDIKKLTEKAVKAAANYNAFLMREKREERRHYFDIQTGIVQSPKLKSSVLPPEMTRPSPYPVALLQGQYSEYYKTYTRDELNYLPVKTALYDPPIRIANPYMPLPPESAVEVPQQVVEGVPFLPTTVQDDTAAGVITLAPARRHVTKLLEAVCVLCGREENRSGASEKCIKCNQCKRETHPSCSDLTDEMLARVVTYSWMCMECKVCVRCSDPGNEDKMIVCDKCDRGYHTFCVGLKSIPEESIWACPECNVSG